MVDGMPVFFCNVVLSRVLTNDVTSMACFTRSNVAPHKSDVAVTPMVTGVRYWRMAPLLQLLRPTTTKCDTDNETRQTIVTGLVPTGVPIISM